MKRNMTGIIILLCALSLLNFQQLFAQAPDTVVVPVMIDGTPLGAINKFIQGDTTATGERNNPDRVYQLQRGQIYFLDDVIQSQDYHLQIIGEKEDPANPFKPATIAPGVRADGSFSANFIRARGDLTLKDIYFMAKPPTASQDIYPAIPRGILMLTDNTNLIIDGCYFEWIIRNTIEVNAKKCDVLVQNCIFRNGEDPRGEWGGAGYRCDSPSDSVIFLNNTIVNCNSQFIAARNIINYLRLEHNTFVNMLNMVIGYPFFSKQAICSNNIFYNMNTMGQDADDLAMYDRDNLIWSTINTDTIYANFLAALGISEQERVLQVNNNCYFHDQEVLDFWDSIDSVFAVPWMNERTKAMFDADEDYPYLDAEDNMNIEPQFTNLPDNLETMLEWCTLYRSTGTVPDFYWGWDPDEDYFNIQWKLPEDLSYSEASAFYTGGTDGFPVGDLNWFPDKKVEWEDQMTAIESDQYNNVTAKDFRLYQNYPNPFNPVTEISYQLNKAGLVKLTVFNMLGQQVEEIVNTRQAAGVHRVQWDAGNEMTSGIYYYRLETDGFKATKKMLLLK